MLSTELRFFFKSVLNPSLEKMLVELQLEEQEVRTDFYFPFHQSATCGVKWREGRLEVKSLVRDHHMDLATFQSWEKLMLEEVEDLSKMQGVPVEKKRWLIFYNEKMQPVDPSKPPHCQLEISKLKLAGKNYSSLCLEASGDKEDERIVLVNKTLQNLRQQYPEVSTLLDKQKPQSYPQFLLSTGWATS